MPVDVTKIGKRGTVVIPAPLRKKYGFNEGSQLIIEALPDGVFLRPVVTLPVEIYTPERKAEFILNNTITPEDYALAVKKVRNMGLDPETIPHKNQKTDDC
jgi:AbrB family looped-hinge helix DNA binding protein